jgi:uncharacterized protein YndB with AHSA1/START domain
MVHIEGEIDIARPVEEVFDTVADDRNEPAYNRQMARSEKVTDGPIGVGTRFRATMRGRRRPLVIDVEYTGFDRPRMIASHTTTGPSEVTGVLTFAPVAGGTRMHWSWDLRLGGPMRLFTPVLAVVGNRSERTTWTGLKRLLEGAGAGAAGV